MIRTRRAIAAACGFLLIAATAASAVKDRQAHMKAQGAESKLLYEQLKSGHPDKAVVKAQADKLAASSRELASWFPAGSGPEAGVKTEALKVIWSDPKGFAAAAQKLTETTARLAAAADIGDMAAVGPAAMAVGGACKGCHDKYRAKET